MDRSPTVEQQGAIRRLRRAGWTILYWAQLPELIAVMEAPTGKLAYVMPDGRQLIRPRAKSLWERWKPHVWRLRKEGFIEFLVKKGWRFRGTYAAKMGRRGEIILRRLEEGPTFYRCKFQLKADFWAELIEEHDRKGGGGS
jgi:hypothetical protein